jgi:hypothetical protein
MAWLDRDYAIFIKKLIVDYQGSEKFMQSAVEQYMLGQGLTMHKDEIICSGQYQDVDEVGKLYQNHLEKLRAKGIISEKVMLENTETFFNLLEKK